MSGEPPVSPEELAYYKRQVDELAGENLKLDYTISGLRHELKQKRQGFALLSELQQSVGAEMQISAIFQATVEAINAALGMDRTVVLAPADVEGCYRLTHWLGFREDDAGRLGALSLEMPSAVTGSGGVLLVNKATETGPLVERIREALELPYFICVPVPGEKGPIGLLLSGRLKEARPLHPPLDQGDADTFQAIAGLISASIRNMRVAVLEEADRLKTDFFANISHEFRTPIALTIGPLEQIVQGRYGEIPDRVREQLGIMRRNQERLLGLVSQILDLAKLEAGGMELKAAPESDVNRFVRERAEAFRAAAERRDVELRLSLDPRAAHADVYVDREKLDKLLFNLLSNAVKFTREGHVEVSTEVRDGTLRLSVTDTGIGIKEDQLPHIFDRFRQADGSESREYAGTGIGLALVQEVAKLHGGDVDVFSQYGKGTTFRVRIPLGSDHLPASSIVDFIDEDPPAGEAADASEAAEGARGTAGSASAAGASRAVDLVMEGATDREGAGRLNRETEERFDPDRPTVVYAEDNPDLRRHVHDLLSDEVNLYLAVDGRDGIEMVRRYRPDLVISDQMMPNMSGRDLLRAMRDDEELRRTPVIFLTARVGTEARIRSLEAGADDYLTKPFHEGELLARLRNLIRARNQERELAELARRLEARVEDQMAELVRSGDLKRFLPPAVAERVLQGELGADEPFERRKITVLVPELTGIAEATEGLEPEDVSEVMDDCVRELSSVAIAHGGTLGTPPGRSMVVLFGAPAEMESSAQAFAAADTALSLRCRIADLAAGWRRRGILEEIGLRIGIATGYATVGVFGGDLFRSYTAVGTPVTVAWGLAEEAGVGEILCCGPTHAFVEDRVRATPRGAYDIRGMTRSIEAFEILEAAGNAPSDAAPAGPGPAFLPK